MRRWLDRQLREALAQESTQPLLILDPDEALTEADRVDLSGHMEILSAHDWATLRKVWDLDLSRRQDTNQIAILLAGTDFPDRFPLPWDIEAASRMVTVRWPVPPALRPLFAEAQAQGGALVDAWQETGSEVAAVAAVFKVQFGTPALELEAITRLVSSYEAPPALWAYLATHLQSNLAQRVADAGGSLTPIQDAWRSWLAGEGDPVQNAELAAASGPVLCMLVDGLLAPEPALAKDLPEWTKLGTKDYAPAQLIEELLGRSPAALDSFGDWAQAAAWWGQIRYLASTGVLPSQLQSQVNAAWDTLDKSFQSWLRTRYGQELLSTSALPNALHRVSSFLSQRVQTGSKVLLIVLDGLAFSQWHQIKHTTSIQVLKSSACLAMIPTLTEVSRQAIFAGALPFDYAESLNSTRQEEKQWRNWWKEHGLHDSEIAYSRTQGKHSIEPPNAAAKVAAIVITAVDDLLHDANLFGDAQLTTTLALWLQRGALYDLIKGSVAAGFEVWLTADHGNLECQGFPIPNQGDLTERDGHRVLIYANSTLRENARSIGTPWKPPGFPESKGYPLFADGRKGFHRSGTKVTHGGLSLDEVVVPFVQVIA